MVLTGHGQIAGHEGKDFWQLFKEDASEKQWLSEREEKKKKTG